MTFNRSRTVAPDELKDMKEHYNKERHQIITPDEAAKYLGIKLETLLAFLFSFMLFISPITSQTNYWSQIRYFTPEEFYVNGEVNKIDPVLVLFLDEVRHRLGQPVVITSGVRSKNYNLRIGGKEGSDHTIGTAVDISANDPDYKARLIHHLLSLSYSTTMAIKVLIYQTHIHISTRTETTSVFIN